MEHDPALEAHEHAEGAEHAAHARDPYISRVSITVAILAVLAAGAGSLETVEAGAARSELGTAPLVLTLAMLLAAAFRRVSCAFNPDIAILNASVMFRPLYPGQI